MQRASTVARVVSALLSIVTLSSCGDGGEGDTAELKVVFGQDDALPDQLAAGSFYRAAFTVEWKGGVRGERDGILRVFASRQGDTSEDSTEGEWPKICENEFDDVVSVARLPCQFQAPTQPGLLALQLEVTSKVDGKVIGEGLYTHNIVDPETQESDE